MSYNIRPKYLVGVLYAEITAPIAPHLASFRRRSNLSGEAAQISTLAKRWVRFFLIGEFDI
jgi:hypothetical protein